MFFLIFFFRILNSFLILGIFAFNTFRAYKDFGVITQKIGVVSAKELVPPALTFCITRPTDYNFTITVYNETVKRGEFLESYSPEREELKSIRDLIVTCWVLKPPMNDLAVIKNPPPVPNVPDMEFTTRRFVGESDITTAPILVNIFDPLQSDTSFDFNRFLKLAPDSNRAIQFTRTRSLDLDGKVKRNDIKYNI